jgi:hypothetical protein
MNNKTAVICTIIFCVTLLLCAFSIVGEIAMTREEIHKLFRPNG